MKKFLTCFMISVLAYGPVRAQSPRIVNIVNFIRDIEPRDPDRITKTVLYETVVKQIELMKKYRLGGTFLLQYDALMDERYSAGVQWTPRLNTPIKWSSVNFLFADHLGLTSDPGFTDNVLFLLLESPR